MPHIMVDIEAMSTASDAAIVAIGAVRFDLERGELGDGFYKVVSLKSSQRAGGRVEADTVMWWLTQPEEVRKAITGDDSVLIETALKELSVWIREQPLEGLWGNGADYDNVVLSNAYQRLGWTPAWTYRDNRCYRTIAATFPALEREHFRVAGEVQHNALDDAKTQARHLCSIWELTKK